jgi:hypothetical protein
MKFTTEARTNAVKRGHDTEEFGFVIDERDGRLFLLLVEHAVLNAGKRFVPLYLMEFQTVEQLSKGCKWVTERRALWPSWAAMAALPGNPLREHLARLLVAEPMDMATWGYRVDARPEQRKITLVRLLTNSQRNAEEAIWSGTYKTQRAFKRANRWFLYHSLELGYYDDLLMEHGNQVIDAAIAGKRR